FGGRLLALRVRGRAAVEFDEMGIEVAGTCACFLDHGGQAGRLGLEDLDLMGGAGAGFDEERAALIAITGLAETLAVALSRGIVFEQLADLREREPSVVAQAPDELEP